MRITNKMITAQYTKNLNIISSDLNKLNTKMVTGRKFMTASEDPAAAVKAFKVRRDLAKIEDYQSNIEHARSSLTNAESTLMHMQEMMKEITGKTIAALNGPINDEDRKLIANELRHIQEQLLQSLNANSSDVYHFGGSNTKEKPFSVNVAGELVYNGTPLNSLDYATSAALRKDSQYVDIGLGLQFIDGDINKPIDRRSVFEYSVPGIDVIGYGTTTLASGDVVSNNVYNILGELAAEFESGSFNREKADALFAHFQEHSPSILNSITDIGAKTSYLDFMKDRYDSSTLDLQERQQNIEVADPAETIIHFESQRVAYNAALKMGSQIIQPSIFDFMT